MLDAEGPKVRAPVVWRLRCSLHGRDGAEADDHVHMALQEIASIRCTSYGANPDRELSVRVEKKTVVSRPLSNGTCDAAEVPRDDQKSIQSQALVWPKLSTAMSYAQDMTISLKTRKVVAEFTFPVVPVLLQLIDCRIAAAACSGVIS